MSCAKCEEIKRHGRTPPCQAEGGGERIPGVNACWIPFIGADESKVLKIRGLLVSLNGIVEGSLILREYGATRDDLDLLAQVEDVIKEHHRNDDD